MRKYPKNVNIIIFIRWQRDARARAHRVAAAKAAQTTSARAHRARASRTRICWERTRHADSLVRERVRLNAHQVSACLQAIKHEHDDAHVLVMFCGVRSTAWPGPRCAREIIYLNLLETRRCEEDARSRSHAVRFNHLDLRRRARMRVLYFIRKC